MLEKLFIKTLGKAGGLSYIGYRICIQKEFNFYDFLFGAVLYLMGEVAGAYARREQNDKLKTDLEEHIKKINPRLDKEYNKK